MLRKRFTLRIAHRQNASLMTLSYERYDKKGCCIKIFGTILLILIILITFSSAIKCDAS